MSRQSDLEYIRDFCGKFAKTPEAPSGFVGAYYTSLLDDLTSRSPRLASLLPDFDKDALRFFQRTVSDTTSLNLLTWQVRQLATTAGWTDPVELQMVFDDSPVAAARRNLYRRFVMFYFASDAGFRVLHPKKWVDEEIETQLRNFRLQFNHGIGRKTGK